jgi:hypothetical protein
MWMRRQYRRIAAAILPAATALLALMAYADPLPHPVDSIVVAIPWFAIVAVLICLIQTHLFLKHDDQRPSERLQIACQAISIPAAGASYPALLHALFV